MTALESSRILVIDDVPSARRVVGRLLQKIGFTQVEEASCGKDAIAKLGSGAFTIVICDLNLGDMKGIDILAHARQEVGTKNVPFLLITSDPTKEDVVVAAECGNTDFLLKPFTKQTLEDRLKSWL